MSAVTGLLGIGGGAGGTGFSTNPGTNPNQINQSYNQNQELLKALGGANGVGNQSQVYNQFQNVANGQGPNPAQTMLNTATGNQVADQAALQAGQRGASSNVGLIARNAGNMGAKIGANNAATAANVQSTQALGALGQAGNIANTQVANQIGANQNMFNTLQGANTSNNQIQGSLANTVMQGQQKVLGGIGQGLGYIAGMVPKAAGGPIEPMQPSGPQSSIGKYLAGPGFSEGGSVPALVSPGEIFLRPDQVKPVAEGKVKASQIGEKIPGQAKVKGNSYSNDTVPKKLPVGGVVVPRDKVQSKNSDYNSAKFVQSVLAKKRMKYA